MGSFAKKIPLDTTEFTNELLQDARGTYYKLAGVSETTLLQYQSLFSATEISLLKSAISSGDLNLLISGVSSLLDATRRSTWDYDRHPAEMHW